MKHLFRCLPALLLFFAACKKDNTSKEDKYKESEPEPATAFYHGIWGLKALSGKYTADTGWKQIDYAAGEGENLRLHPKGHFSLINGNGGNFIGTYEAWPTADSNIVKLVLDTPDDYLDTLFAERLSPFEIRIDYAPVSDSLKYFSKKYEYYMECSLVF